MLYLWADVHNDRLEAGPPIHCQLTLASGLLPLSQRPEVQAWLTREDLRSLHDTVPHLEWGLRLDTPWMRFAELT